MYLISCKYFRQSPTPGYPDGFVTEKVLDPLKYKYGFEKNSLNTSPGLPKNIVRALINVYEFYDSTGKLEYMYTDEIIAPVYKPKKVINA